MQPIQVDTVEFYPKQNAQKHNTSEFGLISEAEIPTPIFRRGNNFYFAVRFNREIIPESDAIRIQFLFGE